MESDEERNVALKPTRERHVDLAARVFVEKLVPRGRNNPDDFERFVRFSLAAEVFACSDVIATSLCPWRIVAGELNSLTERVTIRPKFFREDLVYDCDQRARRLCGLRLIESPTAYDWQIDRSEIIRADAVPSRLESKTLGSR